MRDIASSTASGAVNVIAALFEARTGQHIGAKRAWRIETALKPMLRDRAFASIDALAHAVANERGGTLADAIVEAMLNQETSFFRDGNVIEHAVDAVTGRSDDAPRPRIWSIGCSTGQEPLSLAMLFAERVGSPAAHPEIIATDVSRKALDRARQGRYSQFEIQRGLPVRRMIQWFDGDDEGWTAKSDLLARIQYRRHNLVGEAPIPGRFDLILCRNVLLYFSPATRKAVFTAIAGALRPGGLLLLGAGETVIGQTDLLVPSTKCRGFYCASDTPAMRYAAAG